jgi:Zn-dependent protease
MSRAAEELGGTSGAKMGKVQIMQIGGIPLVLDASVILLIVLFLLPDIQSGSPEQLLIGAIVVIGVLFSVVLHELGHAFAGQLFGIRTSHMELNGLGGLCYLEGQPRERWKRIVISLAGPFVTFLVWRFCLSADNLIQLGWDNGAEWPLDTVYLVLWQIGMINLFMLIFNLMPAFPLDGGNALKELIAMRFDPYKANWVVAWLGLLVAGVGIYLGFNGYGMWMMMICLLLALQNYQILTTETKAPWQRWN